MGRLLGSQEVDYGLYTDGHQGDEDQSPGHRLVAGVKVVLCLPLALAPESFCGPLRKIYCVAAGVLRLGENEYATVSYPLHLWVNSQRP